MAEWRSFARVSVTDSQHVNCRLKPLINNEKTTPFPGSHCRFVVPTKL